MDDIKIERYNMRQTTEKEIFAFLDRLATINHNEPEAKLLRTNFGLDRENARYMVWAWKEGRKQVEELLTEIANDEGFLVTEYLDEYRKGN